MFPVYANFFNPKKSGWEGDISSGLDLEQYPFVIRKVECWENDSIAQETNMHTKFDFNEFIFTSRENVYLLYNKQNKLIYMHNKNLLL